jgi:toxin ParE1/3/4
VAKYRLSRLAEADLFDIGSYTLQTWGEDQARRYLDDLVDRFEKLAVNPKLGRACDHIKPGFRRMECGRHVIFYEIEDTAIIVWRILHNRMLPDLHLQES